MLMFHYDNGVDLLEEIGKSIDRNASARAKLERDRQLQLLFENEVIGMTTTAVSKYQELLKELRPEVVIVEEAAEVLESHILSALHAQTSHLILIGDHQQLQPNTAVYRLSKQFQLDVSLFERLIRNGAAHVSLTHQRRMRPQVSQLIKTYYPELQDNDIVTHYPDVPGVRSNIFWVNHRYYEGADD